MLYIAFIFLSLSVLSVWVKKSSWIWGFLSAFALAFAQQSHQLSPKALIPLLTGTALFWTLQWKVEGLFRFVIVGAALILASALFLCVVPGLPDCFRLFNVQINFGKVLIALPILGWLIPTLNNGADWRVFFKSSFPLSLIGSFLLVLGAFYLYPPTSFSFFLKSPSSLLLSGPLYLLSIVIPEEVLLRGFLQKELFQWTGKGGVGHIITVLLSSSLFCLFHLAWIGDLFLLALLFFAGCIYGALYQITKVIEASICCRTITFFFYFFILSKEGFF